MSLQAALNGCGVPRLSWLPILPTLNLTTLLDVPLPVYRILAVPFIFSMAFFV
jgi:hypothetical protein